MRVVCLILLIACISSSAYGFLQEPQMKHRTLYQKLRDSFLSSMPLNITTQCNSVNLTSYYNGTALSGYLNVGIKNSSSALGFIFFGAKGVPVTQLKNIPTIIWLEGGPGCSSLYGTFIENGPLKIIDQGNGTFSFSENPYAWTNDYNVIYIDQPVGTGISYAQNVSDIPVDEDQIASQFYHALEELYFSKNGCFNQVGINAKDTPLFIYGISYAGKYIPSIAEYIIQKGNKFNLKSIGLGDGFTSTYYDTQAINQYSYDHGQISLDQFNKNEVKVKSIQHFIREKEWKNATDLFLELLADANPNNVDIYNINRPAMPDASFLDNLMNSEYGRNLFSLKTNTQYVQCDPVVYQQLSTDFIQNNCVAKVNYLLNEGIYVHIYNGDLDMIVPYYTPQLWLPTLEWHKIHKFLNSPIRVWRNGSTGSLFGYKQQHNLLTFSLVFNAGHMVTQDQPEAGYHLIKDDVSYVLTQNKRN